MEENAAARDKYPKAKIEEQNLRLPKALLKPDGDPTDDLSYMKIFEDDTQRAKHLAEAIAAGAKLDRRVYRIRNKELVKFIGKDFEGMTEVHRASKATIGILADAESNLHSHSYVDMVGTVEEVTTAEGLILDNILKTYSILAYPVILMPPTIYGDNIIIPVHKVINILGTYGTNILRMEMESGAWIKIEPGAPPGGSERDRLINVFGPRDHVIKAIKLIRAVTYEPAEACAAQEELWREFNEPCWRDFFERREEEEAQIKEYSGEPQQAEEGVTEDGESEKLKKSKKPSWSQIVERKKSVSGESEKKKQEQRKTTIRIKKSGSGGEGTKQTEGEFKEPSWSQTFLRKKSLSEGSKRTEGGDQSGKEKNVFREPGWSETFGHMKIGGGEGETEESKSKESGGSGKGKQEEEHVEQETRSEVPKGKSQEDAEEACAKNKESEDKRQEEK